MMGVDLKAFKQRLFAEAEKAGFKEYEIYSENGNSFSVKIFNGEVSEYKNASSAGLSFRGNYNGKMGYAFTEKIDDEVIGFLIESAKQNAMIIEDEEIEELYAGDKEYAKFNNYNPALTKLSAKEKIDAALLMEKTALGMDERVKAVDYCVMATGESEILIANSLGLDISDKSNYVYSYIYPRVEENGQVKMGGDVFVGNDFTQLDPVALAKSAVEKSLSYLGAAPVPSKRYGVIFDPVAAGDFLGTFVNIFFADKVQKGFSLLKGKIDQKIASEAVTILDDPLMEGALASTPFDSEGVASYRKTVIERGVLQTYLHNTKTAKKDGVKSTGNGFKSGFKSSVNISATNFYVQPSETSAAELMKKMGDGIMVTDLAGLHSGANPISGDFSLSAEGYLIEKGKIVRAVEQITIAGNFFQLLNDIVAVGDDLLFQLPSSDGNIACPSLYVKELNIAGI